MKRALMAITVVTILLPTISLSHEGRRRDDDRWRDRYERVARPGGPSYYCHRHERRIHRDDTRRHCHSVYNDPHGVVRDRPFRNPWSRR